MSLFPTVGRKQASVRISWWLVVAFLVLGIFLHLVPFYVMLAPPSNLPRSYGYASYSVAQGAFSSLEVGV